MPNHFKQMVSTPAVLAAQKHYYGRAAVAGPAPERERLTGDEIAFIAERDSFYLSTISESGWPYIQHRGGPKGFLHALDPQTRKDLQKVFEGSNKQYAGKGEQMNAGLLYLNPSLAASSRLFNELNYDTPLLERFIVASSKLVTDVADRRDDLAGLVDHLATTTTAIGSEQQALGESIRQLPPFMRRANTTFLNLRATLDDLDPLVADSKPVAKKLRPNP